MMTQQKTMRQFTCAQGDQIGRLFTLCSFVKLTEKNLLSGYFFNCKSYVLIITKNVLGYILGDFFSNAFGHPACAAPSHQQSRFKPFFR
jgi:hypothetical protein